MYRGTAQDSFLLGDPSCLVHPAAESIPRHVPCRLSKRRPGRALCSTTCCRWARPPCRPRRARSSPFVSPATPSRAPQQPAAQLHLSTSRPRLPQTLPAPPPMLPQMHRSHAWQGRCAVLKFNGCRRQSWANLATLRCTAVVKCAREGSHPCDVGALLTWERSVGHCFVPCRRHTRMGTGQQKKPSGFALQGYLLRLVFRSRRESCVACAIQAME